MILEIVRKFEILICHTLGRSQNYWTNDTHGYMSNSVVAAIVLDVAVVAIEARIARETQEAARKHD